MARHHQKAFHLFLVLIAVCGSWGIYRFARACGGPGDPVPCDCGGPTCTCGAKNPDGSNPCGMPPGCTCTSFGCSCECTGTRGCTKGSGGGNCTGSGCDCTVQGEEDWCPCRTVQCGGKKQCPECCGASVAGWCNWCPIGGAPIFCNGYGPCTCLSDSSACTKCSSAKCNNKICAQCTCTCGQTGCPPAGIRSGYDRWQVWHPGGPCGCARYGCYTCDGTAGSAAYNCCSGCGNPGVGTLGVGCSTGSCVVHCGSAFCPCVTPTVPACACAGTLGYCQNHKPKIPGSCLRCPKPGNSLWCKGPNGGGGFAPCTYLTYP
jgi:hypothetical protein